MKILFSWCAIAAIAGGSIACSGQDRRSSISSDRAGGASTGSPGQTTIVGCLEAGDRPGVFLVRARRDATDRQSASRPIPGTSGTTGRPGSASGSTTGIGGDAIRNAPTIGAGAASRTYELVLSDSNTENLERNAGAQVSVVGVVEDTATAATSGEKTRPDAHTIRASSITKVADRCDAAR